MPILIVPAPALVRRARAGTTNVFPSGNPIESTFATVRDRTGKTKGCLSRKTGLAMAFKLMMSAQGKWRKLNGANRLPEIIQGITFVDGIKQSQTAAPQGHHQVWMAPVQVVF